ncbi:MAG TPA: M13 family metallopeptidase [bacterium]|nr:M13 family metallopeptidase [bacterium]HMW32748.1 M13 family metallopeptidase [bacterium]HNB57494.1 M13 family metallopeptidase [bacterium]HNF85157.1 M13 family metallopeptidase [bacterium]HNH30584.1 M13 family metallopeptidase [bacterium]
MRTLRFFMHALLCITALSYFACADKAPMIKGKTIEAENLDTTVAPCNDFYQYANGGWLKNNPIPAAFSRWGSFNELADFNTTALRGLLETAANDKNAQKGSNQQKIGDFYYTGMDSAGIEAAGLKPLASEFARIDGIKDVKDLAVVLSYYHQFAMDPAFNVFVGQDDKNSTMMIANAYQGGLGLPDRDYYTKTDEKSKTIRSAYEKYIAKLLMLSGIDEKSSVKAASAIMGIETQLAKASMTRVEQRDPNAVYHKMTVEELEKTAPNFMWKTYFESLGLAAMKDLNVGQPHFFKELSGMIKSVSIADWKSYLRFHVLNYAAPYMSSDFVNASFEFQGKTLTGQKEMQPRWKRVSNVTDQSLGDALGQVYVEKYFPPASKKKALAMVNNVKEAFRDRLMKLSWMSDSTRQKALAKLNTFVVKIGYPDKWKDYSTLEIDRQSYLGNVMRAQQFESKRLLAQVGQPVDRNRWGMTPPTVNAYYNTGMNEIVFPAGILQYPFFNPDADDAFNYGSMGAVIGHEITHGFDDQGSQYDAEGNLKNWWSQEDRKQFESRADRVVKQFDGFVAIDSMHVNGKLTLGENIADLGGLSIAYDAMIKAQNGKTPPKIGGFTAEQRFFLAWAQIWRTNIRDERLRLMINTDPHSPGKFRVNGPLENMPEFYKAFGCKESDGMVKTDSNRAQIW